MTDPSASKPLIDSALRAIADGTPLPWHDLNRTDNPAEVDVLRTLDAIASAYRAQVTATAPQQPPLFRWGELDAQELLGEGSFGDVYRAFDRWLGRHVALKLFRDSGNAAGLDEARRLARVRHRNVLSVYGCGVHDGRAGLWSELVEGRTLASAVASEGAFSEVEAVRVGHDIAQALMVVHGVGLVHGDVKAENVMREAGGRIVLMDFGAGGDARLLAGERLISSTPRYLPPEVLDGAALSTGSDIYAFGVLMFLLLSGRYPYVANDVVALREEQRRARPMLRGLHPQLNHPLCALVEDCLANDPAQRPISALALRDRLAASMPAAATPLRRLPLSALIVALGALVVAVVALWPRLMPPAWETTVQFLRAEPSGGVEIAANSTLRVGDRLRLSLRSSRDAYVYVLNEDAAGNATVLFPLAEGRPTLQHAGSTLVLPGGSDPALAWEVTADSAREEFVVISSLVPLVDLDKTLANWKHAQARKMRSVGAIVKAPLPQLHGEHLRRILDGLTQDSAYVRVWQYTFPHNVSAASNSN